MENTNIATRKQRPNFTNEAFSPTISSSERQKPEADPRAAFEDIYGILAEAILRAKRKEPVKAHMRKNLEVIPGESD